MRIEPVYLLAPTPDRRVKLSRRAFVGSLAGSALFGGCIGFGARAAIGDGGRAVGDAPAKTDGDVEVRAVDGSVQFNKNIEWARALAKGDIDELYRRALGFLLQIDRVPSDEVLWSGVDRLVVEVPTRPDDRHRAAVAATLLPIVDRLRPDRISVQARARLVELTK